MGGCVYVVGLMVITRSCFNLNSVEQWGLWVTTGKKYACKYDYHICNKIEEIEDGEHIKMKLRTSIGIYTQLVILNPHNTP